MAYRDRHRQREAERRWYQANKRRVLDKKLRKKARIRAFVRAAKDRPCADCGLRFPYYVMDFDHVEGTKVDLISRLAVAGSVTKLMAELEKCEVVCANCHRIRTFTRLEAARAEARAAEAVVVLEVRLRLFDESV